MLSARRVEHIDRYGNTGTENLALMCGIVGEVGVAPPDDASVARMLQAIAHRGPDGTGQIRDDHAAFGHQRLSIIDLAGGAQPLISADGTIWLVANGEIYNYRELRKELAQAGVAQRTDSDCEVILGLYQLYGDGLLQKLRGMFAFALWDSRQRRLLLARDHLGQKPLFYSQQRGQLLFASEIKAITATSAVGRNLCLEALDQYLGLRLVAPPLTMFSGINKLPPGHKLVFEPGRQPVISAYWSLHYCDKLQGNDQNLLEQLQEQLVESLKLHMVSDVEVGAYLSGGLDSSLLVALIARHLGIADLQTFTLALPYQHYSEGPAARQVASQFGTRHHEQLLKPALLSTLPDLLWHLDEPSDPLALCSYVLAQETRQHVKVVIGGDGGDELFAGYDRYWGFQVAERLARAPRLVSHGIGAVARLMPSARWYKSYGHRLRWLQQAAQLRGGQRHAASLNYFYFDAASRAELFSADALKLLDGFRAESVVEQAFEQTEGDNLDKMLHADTMIRLPDHPVMISDRMSMAHGLEVRSPFMDHRLVEFCARLPSNLKLRGRTLRFAQRELARKLLPPTVLARQKQGFASALPYMLRNELNALYRNVSETALLVKDGVLSSGPIRELLRQHTLGGQDHGARLWLIANAELWYRMAIKGESREQLTAELAQLA